MTLVLWHCKDARSFRPLWALEELGLAYELKLLPFPPRALEKSYLGENPLGTIPLLVDGETRMTESVAIPHYLAMTHGGGRLTIAPGEAGYGAYLVADAFTMADISVAYALQLAIDIGLESELPPNALAWLRKLTQRPGFQAAKAAQAAG